MNDLLNFNDLLQFIKANWAPVVAGAVLLPFALNLANGVWRRICNRFRTYPTFAAGAIYVDCVTPSGVLPAATLHPQRVAQRHNGNPGGATFLVYNKELRDGWVLPILYDPMLDRQGEAALFGMILVSGVAGCTTAMSCHPAAK